MHIAMITTSHLTPAGTAPLNNEYVSAGQHIEVICKPMTTIEWGLDLLGAVASLSLPSLSSFWGGNAGHGAFLPAAPESAPTIVLGWGGPWSQDPSLSPLPCLV